LGREPQTSNGKPRAKQSSKTKSRAAQITHVDTLLRTLSTKTKLRIRYELALHKWSIETTQCLRWHIKKHLVFAVPQRADPEPNTGGYKMSTRPYVFWHKSKVGGSRHKKEGK